jgi:hypothetical protein
MKLQISLFILFVAIVQVALTQKTCPGGGNCNGHGSCSNGRCICSQGYAGDDCSYVIVALTSGNKISNQHAARGQWLYYTIQTNAGSALVVEVNQTSVGGDVDLYMQMNQIPTLNSPYKDTSINQNFALTIPDAGTGTWYIGIYGFVDTTYAIKATSNSQCPQYNNCNGNGVCTNGQCVCNNGWIGADCSQQILPLTLNTPTSGFVQRGNWVLFQFTITSNNLLMFIVNETQPNGDVDLYLKYNAVPTLFSYDYRDISISRNFELDVNEPHLGTWYAGLYGYRNTSYIITVKTSQGCPSRCSLHGTCEGAQCRCNSQFTGVYCENMQTDLQLGLPQGGYVDDNSWNYYKFRPNSGSNMKIRVMQQQNGDCDLYAQVGHLPSRTDYAARDIGLLTDFTLTINNPSDIYWYFGVYGYHACQYNITVSLDASCPGTPVCSGHGTCVSGICVCSSGYSGQACDTTGNSLINGRTSSGNLTQFSWNYYTVSVVNTTYLVVDLKEGISSGFIWLYASKNSIPDTRNYDYSDQETNTQYHRLRITFDQPQNSVWQIGVYGNPFSQGTMPYQIAAWYTPF